MCEYLPVMGGAKKVVNGSARYIMAISSTVIPMLRAQVEEKVQIRFSNSIKIVIETGGVVA